MKFLADESLEASLVAFLSDLGHDVTYIPHDYTAALADHEVLAIARRENRIVVTNDPDFGELLVRHSLPHTGVIVLRLEEHLPLKERWLRRLASGEYGPIRGLVVVSPGGVRIRPARDKSRKAA